MSFVEDSTLLASFAVYKFYQPQTHFKKKRFSAVNYHVSDSSAVCHFVLFTVVLSGDKSTQNAVRLFKVNSERRNYSLVAESRLTGYKAAEPLGLWRRPNALVVVDPHK